MLDNGDEGKHYWYVRHRGRISGPYASGLIRRHVLLGKIGHDDELSHDLKGWKRLTQLSELVPAVMKIDTDDPIAKQRLMAARRWADDREYGHAAVLAETEERRSTDADMQLNPRQQGSVLTAKLENRKRARWKNNFFAVLVIIIITTVAGSYFLNTKPVKQVLVDCSAVAAPGVDWSNCFLPGVSLSGKHMGGANMMNTNLVGADLNGADLSGAVLSYSLMNLVDARSARLVGATLIGVNLQGADLSQANMMDADLSYANLFAANLSGVKLSGARLDNARWVDGRVCQPGSLSRCE